MTGALRARMKDNPARLVRVAADKRVGEALDFCRARSGIRCMRVAFGPAGKVQDHFLSQNDQGCLRQPCPQLALRVAFYGAHGDRHIDHASVLGNPVHPSAAHRFINWSMTP